MPHPMMGGTTTETWATAKNSEGRWAVGRLIKAA